jgi:tetratricopeptide (TPR) repeat protein
MKTICLCLILIFIVNFSYSQNNSDSTMSNTDLKIKVVSNELMFTQNTLKLMHSQFKVGTYFLAIGFVGMNFSVLAPMLLPINPVPFLIASSIIMTTGHIIHIDSHKYLNFSLEDMYSKYEKSILLSDSADMYFEKKFTYTAMSLYKKSLRLNPANVNAYNKLGIIYNLEQRQSKSYKMFSRAIFFDSNYAEAYFNRGNIYLNKIFNPKKGCPDWKRASELGHKMALEYYNNYCNSK